MSADDRLMIEEVDKGIRQGVGAAWLVACIESDTLSTSALVLTMAPRRRRAKAGAETGTGPSQSR